MKRFALAATPLLFGIMLVLVACGKGGPTSPGGTPGTVTMTSDNFAIHSITVKAGDTVHFVDPSSGGTHVICLGNDESCDKSATGPAALKAPGFTINAGDPPKDVVFDTAGTYKITCTVHPNMNLTVTVQ